MCPVDDEVKVKSGDKAAVVPAPAKVKRMVAKLDFIFCVSDDEDEQTIKILCGLSEE
jgi:hypothetical protein